MTLMHIAIKNLRRRKSKMTIVIVGMSIAIATIVSVYSVVETMKADITEQMSEYGANIVITADKGAVSFYYGGIRIPEVLFDVKQLTSQDVSAIDKIPNRSLIRFISPKILGVISSGGQSVIIAGSDLKSDLALKPWLLLNSTSDTSKIDLSRGDITQLQFSESTVILGAIAAQKMGLKTGDSVELKGKKFAVIGVLQENGSPEDSQVMMDIAVAQGLLERPGEVNLIELSVDYRLTSEDSILEQLKIALPDAKITSLRQSVLGQDEMLARLTRFGTLVAVLVLLIGMLAAALTISSAVRERTREIGIFRAIGFRKLHITIIIMLEGIILSAIGGLIGFVAGTVIAQAAGPFLANTSMRVPWRFDVLAASILLAVIVGMLASLYPALQAAGKDPVKALRFM